jgi:ubiquinone/menaquinone biosynthesis C-methylase UbiE
LNTRHDTYVTDVEYTGQFFAHLAPAWLGYIAAINGYAAPRIDGPFTWCELGCGKGLTSLVLAATHPSGDFHACDFNAAHVEYAEKLRRAAHVENVRFYAHSFAQMLEADLPQFDFITLHGVYSWVPEAVRGEIREFIRRKLKPGGLVMVSYNAMPGWAHLQPLRRMMRAYAAEAPGNSLDKARAAFAQLDFLAKNGAAYFKANPAAAKHLEEIAQHDIRYVAHEYLTPHGDPFHFQQVAEAMRGVGLAFAGNMMPADNYPALMAAPQFQPLLAAAPTRTALEARRDFVMNTAFRQDLYAAQPEVARAPEDIALERFAGIAFCLTSLPDNLPLSRTDGAIRFDLTPQRDAVRAVHALLAKGPASAAEIHRAAAMRAPEETSFLIQQLVVSQHLAPCPAARSASGWSRLNAALVDAAVRERWQEVPLACPHTGAAASCEPVYAATIETAALLNEAEVASWQVLTRLRAHDHPVNRHSTSGEPRPATDDEVRAYVAATWQRLRDAGTPDARRMRLLGILS